MRRIAFFCIPAHGHTNPTLPVVRALCDMGHEVRYYSFEAFRGAIEAMGATFMPCDTYDMGGEAASGAEVSPFWLVMAVLLTVTLQAASPPVTGIGLLSYAVIFAQLGIPEDALTTAMAVDILFGFVTAPLNQAMLQMELVLEADRSGVLDRSVLEKQ